MKTSNFYVTVCIDTSSTKALLLFPKDGGSYMFFEDALTRARLWSRLISDSRLHGEVTIVRGDGVTLMQTGSRNDA